MLGCERREEAFRATIPHEFGHVLGCLHEHSTPFSGIRWIKEKVYKYYKMRFKREPDMVDSQILDRAEDMEMDHSRFDPDSIMMYPIDPALVENGVRYKLRTELSDLDKTFIRQTYPPIQLAVSKSVFHSWDYQKWDRRDPKNTAFVLLANLTTAPSVAVGLVQFDMDCQVPLRVKAAAALVTASGFNIQTETWDGAEGMFSAGATWFNIQDPQSSDFQTGNFDASKFKSGKQHFSHHEEVVKFKHPFTSTPEVVVWIRGYHIGTGSDIVLNVSAHDITTTSFKICVNAKGDTRLYRAMLTYVAYPGDKKGVFSGTTMPQKTTLFDEEKDNRCGYSEVVDMSERKEKQGFSATDFDVYAGISSFDISGKTNIRLETVAQKTNADVSEDSFWVHVKTWNNTDCRSASAIYLAAYHKS